MEEHINFHLLLCVYYGVHKSLVPESVLVDSALGLDKFNVVSREQSQKTTKINQMMYFFFSVIVNAWLSPIYLSIYIILFESSYWTNKFCSFEQWNCQTANGVATGPFFLFSSIISLVSLCVCICRVIFSLYFIQVSDNDKTSNTFYDRFSSNSQILFIFRRFLNYCNGHTKSICYSNLCLFSLNLFLFLSLVSLSASSFFFHYSYRFIPALEAIL